MHDVTTMKFSMHSLLFFVPDEVSSDVLSNIIIVILCIILGISLLLLYRRIKNGAPFAQLEGMTTRDDDEDEASANSAEVQNIKTQTTVLQTTFDQLKAGVEDQTNRINGNSHSLLNTMSDTPSRTNSVTHANINQDDPSKTKIPQIDMS
jgi:hypothetical protein